MAHSPLNMPWYTVFPALIDHFVETLHVMPKHNVCLPADNSERSQNLTNK